MTSLCATQWTPPPNSLLFQRRFVDQEAKITPGTFCSRRGPNHSLKITIATKQRSLESPPTDHSSEEYLRTASRKLTIDELHQHALDTVLLSNEFWVRGNELFFLSLRSIVSLQNIPTNHLEKLRICGAGTKNRYGTIIASRCPSCRRPHPHPSASFR